MCNPALADALSAFPNVAVLTVNYDTVLEKGMGESAPGVKRFPISHAEIAHEHRLHMLWSPTNRLLNGKLLRQLCVVHLHGLYYDRSDSYGFTLTRGEYESPGAMLMFLAFVLTGITGVFNTTCPLSLVFVGCKDTVVDRHFRALWVAQSLLRANGWFSPTVGGVREPEHFWLVSTWDFAYATRTAEDIRLCTGVVINVVCFGDFPNLAPFITGLAS